jgi:hypothetical protein
MTSTITIVPAIATAAAASPAAIRFHPHRRNLMTGTVAMRPEYRAPAHSLVSGHAAL